MKIYTRTGDKGTTSLFGGERVAKNIARVEAYGTIDELNSTIGMVIAEISNIKYPFGPSSGLRLRGSDSRRQEFKIQNYDAKLKNELIKIQNDLFEIGAYLATPRNTTIEKGKKIHKELASYLTQRVKKIEKEIDNLTKQLSPMKNFILPGGGNAASIMHFARSVSRRAERRVVALASQEDIGESLLVYMNRLSDLLFTTARFVNKKEEIEEIKWSSRA